MTVAFLGTSEFAATVLRCVAASDHRPALVVTPPDRPAGRGRRLTPPPAATAARELGLDLHQAASVNDDGARERLRAAARVVLVCAFGQLIREPLLSELELLNIHPSLIPRWRGAAPIERAIMAGDGETGVTIMRVTAGLDSGPVALRRRTPIAPGEDYGALAARLAALSGELAVEALELRSAGRLSFVEQDEAQATYAAKLTPAERRLDPAADAAALERTVRALTPQVGAYLELAGGERLGVRVAVAQPDAGGLRPGEVRAAAHELLVGCGAGALRLEVVQPAGGRPMPVEAYLRGHPAPRLAP